MSSTKLHSPELLNLAAVKTYASNIHLQYNPDLKQYFQDKFPGFYIFKVPASIVDAVYFESFFLSQEYFDAIEKGVFSNKWEEYIRSKRVGEYYILDAHDYNGQVWKHLSESCSGITIEFFGDKFWLYHDLGHVYLNHLYSHGSFMHKDEMDASLFAAMKLIFTGEYNEAKIKSLVVQAAKDCLKTGNIINHEDIKYLFTYMEVFRKTLQA